MTGESNGVLVGGSLKDNSNHENPISILKLIRSRREMLKRNEKNAGAADSGGGD